MNDVLDLVKEISKKNYDVTQKVMDYFQPLRERYVTKIRKQRIVPKKFLWFKWESFGQSYYFDYVPLRIQVASNWNTVNVKIYTMVGALNGNAYVIDDFPISLFEKSCFYISHDEQIKKFIQGFILIATPKYVKYNSWVNHIQDEELKYKISNELEKLFESEEFNQINNSEKRHQMAVDLVKKLETE
ncbi:MAG: hypothetical protein ACOC56_06490 [Atribacterota bacterium]